MQEYLDEEFHEVYEEPNEQKKIFSSETLHAPISELALTSPAPVLKRGATIREAMNLMQTAKADAVLITDSGLLDGIFTERDVLMRVVGKNLNPDKALIDDVMSPAPEALLWNDTIAYVLKVMSEGKKGHVPVVDDAYHPVAVVSVKNIIEFIAGFFPQDILNTPARPIHRSQKREGA